MKKLALALLLVLSINAASIAHADICSQKTNLSTAPSTPLRSVTNGWFQWLNQSGTASCSGSSTHLTCTKSGVTYTFDYSCAGSTCYVEAYAGGTWRNEATMGTGEVWGWTWDGWKNGILQMSCQVIDPATTVCTYSTCD